MLYMLFPPKETKKKKKTDKIYFTCLESEIHNFRLLTLCANIDWLKSPTNFRHFLMEKGEDESLTKRL